MLAVVQHGEVQIPVQQMVQLVPPLLAVGVLPSLVLPGGHIGVIIQIQIPVVVALLYPDVAADHITKCFLPVVAVGTGKRKQPVGRAGAAVAQLGEIGPVVLREGDLHLLLPGLQLLQGKDRVEQVGVAPAGELLQVHVPPAGGVQHGADFGDVKHRKDLLTDSAAAAVPGRFPGRRRRTGWGRSADRCPYRDTGGG